MGNSPLIFQPLVLESDFSNGVAMATIESKLGKFCNRGYISMEVGGFLPWEGFETPQPQKSLYPATPLEKKLLIETL